jgi:ParB family chromosome partitioning protein
VTSKAKKLGTGASFGGAPTISARRAAIAAVTDAPTSGVVPSELPIGLISENPDNPREVLQGIQEMANTFESVGQIMAITVASVSAYLKTRPGRAGELEAGAEYIVVDGHRRLAAARLLGWDTIRVMVDDAKVSSDERLLEAAFIANTQREDMSDLEEAAALKQLVEFAGSQEKAATRIGKTQAYISQRLSLLKLSPELQADLEAGVRKVEHVRGLASLSPEEQKVKADERAAQATPKRAKASARGGAASGSSAASGIAIHNGVMNRSSKPTAESGAATVPQQSAAPSTAEKETPAPSGGGDAAILDLPWDNPAWFDQQLRLHMTPEHREVLAWLLRAASD